MEAQKFINLHGLTECYECDGVFFKRKENADARAVTSKLEVITHTLNAGAKKNKKEIPQTEIITDSPKL